MCNLPNEWDFVGLLSVCHANLAQLKRRKSWPSRSLWKSQCSFDRWPLHPCRWSLHPCRWSLHSCRWSLMAGSIRPKNSCAAALSPFPSRMTESARLPAVRLTPQAAALIVYRAIIFRSRHSSSSSTSWTVSSGSVKKRPMVLEIPQASSVLEVDSMNRVLVARIPCTNLMLFFFDW